MKILPKKKEKQKHSYARIKIAFTIDIDVEDITDNTDNCPSFDGETDEDLYVWLADNCLVNDGAAGILDLIYEFESPTEDEITSLELTLERR